MCLGASPPSREALNPNKRGLLGGPPFASRQVKVAEARTGRREKSRLWQREAERQESLPCRLGLGGAQNWRGPGQPVFLPRLQLEAAFSLFVPAGFKTSCCLESSLKGRPFWVASEIWPDAYFDHSALNYSVSSGSILDGPSSLSPALLCPGGCARTQPAALGLWGLAPLLSVPSGGQRGAIQPGDPLTSWSQQAGRWPCPAS